MLTNVLKDFGFSEKEADIYLICLQLGHAPVSSIARNTKEHRVTVYSILKNMVQKGRAYTIKKKNVTYYAVKEPNKLLIQLQEKYEKFEQALPQFMALSQKYDNKPIVQFYEGLDGLKGLMKEIIMSDKEMEAGQAFLTFAGNSDIDPQFQQFLSHEFIPQRLQCARKTKAIIPSKQHMYTDYTKKHHEYVVIKDPIFALGNEIVIYGQNKVAILMYSPEEMSGLVIQSQTLHTGLTNIFNLLRKTHK